MGFCLQDLTATKFSIKHRGKVAFIPPKNRISLAYFSIPYVSPQNQLIFHYRYTNEGKRCISDQICQANRMGLKIFHYLYYVQCAEQF